MKLTIASALAAAGLALAHPASAGITCNLTDQRGNALQYSFARGGHGYTNETVVKRNGVILSNGGPMWTRSSNSAERTMTLQQGDWSLVYEAKPNDTDISRAALFINTTQKPRAHASPTTASMGRRPRTPGPRCAVQRPLRRSRPSKRPPAPAPSYAAPAPSRRQRGRHHRRVPWRAPWRSRFGSHPALMQIDTGAGMTSLTAKAARVLLDAGEAHYSGESQHVHDGERIDEQRAGNRDRPGSRSARTRSTACTRPSRRTRA